MDKDKNLILPPYSQEFIEKCRVIKEDMHRFYVSIGEEVTPQIDGSGRKIVQKRPDGKDYIVEAYMRKKLDEYFPGWSLEQASPLQILAAEWVVAEVNLRIIDEHLLAFGIVPPIRTFYGVDSVRIQYKRDGPRTPENIIDVGDNCKQAVSAAFKYAINRLTNIGDDIYGKRMDLEGAGTIDSIMTSTTVTDITARTMFNEYVEKKHIRPSQMFKILGLEVGADITDYKEAYLKIKKHLGE